MARVAVITGAGGGIGRAATLALAERGYVFALAGRRMDRLEETIAALPSECRTLPVVTDVRDEASVNALFDSTWKEFGRLDLLFNNAGVSGLDKPLEDVSVEEWRTLFETNVTGAFLCLSAAFRMMKTQVPRGGRIINNGSIAAVSPRPNAAPYSASKHAITGLTKSASLEGRRYNIACCQIDIGNAATEMGLTHSSQTLQANGSLMDEPVFSVSEVGRAIAFMDSLPLEANVQFMTLIATAMPLIGRG